MTESNFRILSMPGVWLFPALALAAFLPLLLNPHWGMLSDAGQIVENGRHLFSVLTPSNLFSLFTYDHRPGFHLIDQITWFISRESPLGFYAVRCFAFACTLQLTYLNNLILSKDRGLAILFTFIWFFSSTTFEVIYTLDKGEIFVACFFSAIVYLYLSAMQEISREKRTNPAKITKHILLIVICSSYVMFTKVTGQLMLIFGIVLPLSLYATRYLRNQQKVIAIDLAAEPNLNVNIWHLPSDPPMLWSLTTSAICITSFLLEKIFYISSGMSNFHYGAMTQNPSLVLSHLMTYLALVPDLFVALAFCAIASTIHLIVSSTTVKQTLSKVPALFNEPELFSLALALTLTSAAGCLALLCWNSVLTYIWFPLLSLTLPAFCYFASSITSTRKQVQRALFVLLPALFLLGLPQRLLEAETQFQTDVLFQELTKYLASQASSYGQNTKIGLPFTSYTSYEIGERTRSFTLSRLIPNYYLKIGDEEHQVPIQFYDFVEYHFPSVRSVFPNPMGNVAFVDIAKAKNYQAGAGLDTYNLALRGQDLHMWFRDKLKIGDIVLAPFGDLPSESARIRCAGLFTSTWQSKVKFMPQVELKPLYKLSKPVDISPGHKATIGWMVLQITNSLPISWNIESDGWLTQGASIYATGTAVGHQLNVTTQYEWPKIIGVKYSGKEITVTAQKSKDGLSFLIPLVANEKNESFITITSDECKSSEQDPRRLLLHVDKVVLQ